MSGLSDVCNTINIASRQGKRSVLIRKCSNEILEFLKFMQLHGYVDELNVIHDKRCGKVVVDLNGRLNKCAAINPSFKLPLKDLEKWREQVLPFRRFGHLVVMTNQGIRDHQGCIKDHIGGKILGYFY